MDSKPDPLRPDILAQPSPWPPLLLPVLTALVLIPLLALYFGMEDALIHPFALRFGKPATAIVSAKRVSSARRSSGNYVELNYQYSPDYAPRPEVKVTDEAYAAIRAAALVPIHYIPGCPSCVALDEDYGSARRQGLTGLALFAVVAGLTFFQYRYGRLKGRL